MSDDDGRNRAAATTVSPINPPHCKEMIGDALLAFLCQSAASVEVTTIVCVELEPLWR